MMSYKDIALYVKKESERRITRWSPSLEDENQMKNFVKMTFLRTKIFDVYLTWYLKTLLFPLNTYRLTSSVSVICDMLHLSKCLHFDQQLDSLYKYMVLQHDVTLPTKTRSSRFGISDNFWNSDQSFTILFDIYNTFNFLSTPTPFNFSIKLYDIHSCSNVSPTASSPVKFLIEFLPRDRIFKFSLQLCNYYYTNWLNPFRFPIFSIAFVDNDNFLNDC